MSFGDHIEELRIYLVRAIVGFALAVGISFFFGQYIVRFLAEPVEAQLKVFYERQQKRLEKKVKEEEKYKTFRQPKIGHIDVFLEDLKKLGLPIKKEPKEVQTVRLRYQYQPLEEWQKSKEIREVLGPQYKLKVLAVQEGFVVYFKVCLITGFVIASPWVFFQVWAFIAAGLYPHEKRLVNVYLPFSIFLFLGGVVFCYFIVIPRAINALLWFNELLGFDPDLRISEWLTFAVMVPVVFGFSFQTPLVMLFVYRIGIGTIEIFRKARRYVFFGMAIGAAVLTPTVDPYTMLFLWVPMCLFYELGIYLCKFFPGQPLLDFGVPEEDDEVIEV